MDFMSFDELDLSFDVDQHELDSCLPSLMEDSYTSDETRHDGDDTEVDPMEDDDSSTEGNNILSIMGRPMMKSDSSSDIIVADIHWDPIPVFDYPQSHDSHEYQLSSRCDDGGQCSWSFREQQTSASSSGHHDIQWVPPPVPQLSPPYQPSTIDSTKCTTTTAISSPPSLSSSSLSSLQEELELSRRKLVLSMLRSQESSRYVRRHWRSNDTTSRGGRIRDLRNAMITTLSQASSSTLWYAASSCRQSGFVFFRDN